MQEVRQIENKVPHRNNTSQSVGMGKVTLVTFSTKLAVLDRKLTLFPQSKIKYMRGRDRE